METKKSSAQKVIEVAYERWTLIKLEALGKFQCFGSVIVDQRSVMGSRWTLTRGGR